MTNYFSWVNIISMHLKEKMIWNLYREQAVGGSWQDEICDIHSFRSGLKFFKVGLTGSHRYMSRG